MNEPNGAAFFTPQYCEVSFLIATWLLFAPKNAEEEHNREQYLDRAAAWLNAHVIAAGHPHLAISYNCFSMDIH